MSIKSLLLGSAAGLVAVTGVQAADAVVLAEPEPVEYVRVCDVFGEGFFYIPGTETCLRISGYVRYKMGATSDGGTAKDTPNFEGYEPDGWNKATRARVNFDVRSNTELGMLQGYIRLQGNWGGPDGNYYSDGNPYSDGPAKVDQAWLSLGGLRAGYTESAWAETVFGITNGGSFSDGSLYYGDQQRHLVQYNFGAQTGLFGVLSLEDDALEGDGYIPDIVSVLGYNAGWGAVWGRFGYDNAYNDNGDSGYGVQLGGQFNIPNSGTSIRLLGWYADSDNAYSTSSPMASYWNRLGVPGLEDGNGAAEWSVLASVNHQFTDKVSASAGFQYFKNFYLPYSDIKTDADGYAIDLSVVYEPVKNFEIRAEGNYNKIEDLDGSVSGFLWLLRRF